MFDEGSRESWAGVILPPLWHWFYFLTMTRQADLDHDGHPLRTEDSFMPPIPYPRRMFAGARLRWHRPLIVGRPARRRAQIRDIAMKSGRSGGLAFVTVHSTIHQDHALCLEEEQDIVYREPGPALAAPEPAHLPTVPAGTWSQELVPDTRLLFRFSALTFNAHRIHYDRQYATRDEGYPALVVHGPLTAMLLARLIPQHMPQPIAAFSFRSLRPLFEGALIRLVGTRAGARVDLEAQGPDGQPAMTATAEL